MITHNFEPNQPITQKALEENGWYLNKYQTPLIVGWQSMPVNDEGDETVYIEVQFWPNYFQVWVYDEDGGESKFDHVKTMGQLYNLLESI